MSPPTTAKHWISKPPEQRSTDALNLKGTTRTLDGWNRGSLKNLEEGLLSRSGWAWVDDSETVIYDDERTTNGYPKNGVGPSLTGRGRW